MWWAYFDFVALIAEGRLRSLPLPEQVLAARDSYNYLHLPMVVGIVLFAFAMKSTLAHLGDELGTIEALALCGGPALYLFAYVALRYRVSRTFGGGRLSAAIACSLASGSSSART